MVLPTHVKAGSHCKKERDPQGRRVEERDSLLLLPVILDGEEDLLCIYLKRDNLSCRRQGERKMLEGIELAILSNASPSGMPSPPLPNVLQMCTASHQAPATSLTQTAQE